MEETKAICRNTVKVRLKSGHDGEGTGGTKEEDVISAEDKSCGGRKGAVVNQGWVESMRAEW